MRSPATFHSPAGWSNRCMMLEPKAKHQIRIVNGHSMTSLYVTCACRRGDQPIAKIVTCEEAWIAYNGFHEGTI